MIPILYEKDELLFESNGIGRLADCSRCIVTEERNGQYICEFDYPVTGSHFDDITPGRIIAVSVDGTAWVEPFDIVTVSEPIDGIVTYTAEHVSYRLKGYVVGPISAWNNRTCSEALGVLEAASIPDALNSHFSFSTDKVNTSSYFQTSVPMSVRSMMGGVEGSILDIYGGEWQFDRWNCQLWESRGADNGVHIRYGVNLSDYNRELDSSECYNGIVPYWYNEDPDDGGASLVQAAPVYSGTLPTGRRSVVPMDMSDQFETRPTAAQLRAAATSVLTTDKPYIPEDSIEVNFVQLWQTEEYAGIAELLRCRLCDTVHVDMPMYRVTDLTTKVVATEWDVLLEKFNSMTLGSLQTSFAEALEQGQASELAQIRTKLEQVNERLTPKQMTLTYTSNAYVDQTAFGRISAYRVGGLLIIDGLLALTANMPTSSAQTKIGQINNMPKTAGNVTYGVQVPVAKGGSINVAIERDGSMSIYNYGSTITASWCRFNFAIAVEG